MSLQSNNSVTAFSMQCKKLWENWRKGASGTVRITNRQNTIRSGIKMVTGFMTPLNIVFVDLGGDCGSFSWSNWRLKIDKGYIKRANIKYKDFLELCCTAYHETRHAEQFYRIAQGLACEKISFPDKSKAQMIQEVRRTGSSVRDKIALYEGRSLHANTRSSREMIAKWLSIPSNVAGTAVTAKMGFVGYIQLGKPRWFKRKTAKLEVEEWMRSTYKKTLGEVNEWAQSDAGPYKIYRDQAEEHDAHEIEKVLKAKLIQTIGLAYQANKNKRQSELVTS